MNFKSAIFVLVASAACLLATESESYAQGFQRGGGQIVRRVARTYVARTVPGFRTAQIVRRGVQGTGVGFGGQSFGVGQRFGGSQFGLRNGLQAARLFRRF